MFLINELRHHSQPNFLRMDIKNHGEDWGFSSRDKRAGSSLPPSPLSGLKGQWEIKVIP